MNPNEILKNHEPFIVRMAHHYRYLGYEDIYNQTYLFILEAYHDHNSDPVAYCRAKLRTFIRQECREKRHDYYGLEPVDSEYNVRILRDNYIDDSQKHYHIKRPENAHDE